MTEISEEVVDIPEPERALQPAVEDPAVYDPGGDPPPPPVEPEFSEDPAYDPGGIGTQPDFGDEDEPGR